MKSFARISVFSIIIIIAFNACKVDNYADWKIMNENKYSADTTTKKATEGYKVSDTGLCYKIIHAGEINKRPNADSYIKVKYTGTLITGKVFDSGTYEGQLSSTVKGWKEAIPMLKVGGSMKFFFTSDLGYGSTASGLVPPYSVLNFTVDLLDAQY